MSQLLLLEGIRWNAEQMKIWGCCFSDYYSTEKEIPVFSHVSPLESLTFSQTVLRYVNICLQYKETKRFSMNSQIFLIKLFQDQIIWADILVNFSSVILIHVNNCLICVYFDFPQGIIGETSEIKLILKMVLTENVQTQQ